MPSMNRTEVKRLVHVPGEKAHSLWAFDILAEDWVGFPGPTLTMASNSGFRGIMFHRDSVGIHAYASIFKSRLRNLLSFWNASYPQDRWLAVNSLYLKINLESTACPVKYLVIWSGAEGTAVPGLKKEVTKLHAMAMCPGDSPGSRV